MSVLHHFIPHTGNDHHAPALHRKRHVAYTLFGLGVKGIVMLMALLLPLEVFVTPDALEAQLEEIVVETNELRAAQGVDPLARAPLLYTSATAKAGDMRDNGYFAHISPDGQTVGDAFKAAGYEYRYAGENLSIGYSTAKDVIAAWKKSPTHYRNLVHPVFRDIGVGVAVGQANGSPVPYFVQHFGVLKKDEKRLIAGSFEGEDTVFVLPQSKVFWERIDDGIRIQPEVFLSREVREVVITHFNTDVVLEYEDGSYTTSTALLTTEQALFQPTLPMSIRIETLDGDMIESMIPWQDPPILQPNIIDRYHMAVRYVDSMLPMVIVSRVILLGTVATLLFALIAHMIVSEHHRKLQIGFEALLSIIFLTVLFLV